MLPLVSPIKEFQSQPLVRKMFKSQMDSTGKSNKSIVEVSHNNNRSSYQQYRKQHKQSDDIPVQRLFFKNRESTTRETPQSVFLTKHVDQTLQTKPPSMIDESKYQEKIDFHSRKLRCDQYVVDKRLTKSFRSFKLQENVCQRPTMTANKSRRSMDSMPDRTRKILVVNQLFMNTNSLQYQFMRIPDSRCTDKSRFQVDFINELRNRMKINGKKIFLFLKDGTPIYSHLEISPSDKVIIYSTSPVYRPIYNPQLQELEIQCQTEQNEQIEKKSKPDYTHHVNGIVNTLVRYNYKSMEDESPIENEQNEQTELEQNERFLNSKELKHSLRAIKRDGNFKPILKKMFEDPQQRVEKYSMNFEQKGSYFDQQYIIKNKKIDELEQIEQWYDKELKKIDFTTELQGDINQVHVDSQNPDQEQIDKHIKRVAMLLEPLMNKFLNIDSKIQNQEKQVEEVEEVEVNFNESPDKMEETINYPNMNIKNLLTRKNCLAKLLRINKELFIQNIPKLLAKTSFSQYELHHSYILYCALQQITSQRYKHYNCDDGLDYNTYRSGIYQIFMQSEFLAQEIFNRIDLNYSGFLNWDEFLDLMVSIRAKTLIEKIDLFIQISDSDGNGMLSADEIFKLSKVCLSKYIKNSDDFLDMLCEYYTRLIFDVVGRSIDDEIPFEDIKNAILQERQDSDLLCMFCGADI